MAIKPRAQRGQITARQLRQRRVHGVRSLLLLVSRAITAVTFADGQFAEQHMLIGLHPRLRQAGLTASQRTAVQGQNRPSALRQLDQRRHPAAYPADARHLRRPAAVQRHRQLIGQLGDIRTAGTGVHQGLARWGGGRVHIGLQRAASRVSQAGRSCASSQFFTTRPSSVSPAIASRR